VKREWERGVSNYKDKKVQERNPQVLLNIDRPDAIVIMVAWSGGGACRIVHALVPVMAEP
jgi:hypothetical protein